MSRLKDVYVKNSIKKNSCLLRIVLYMFISINDVIIFRRLKFTVCFYLCTYLFHETVLLKKNV